MKKTLFLLLAGLLLVLISLGPVAAQQFHRMNHANRSKTMKSEHSRKHVRHRDKEKANKRNPKHHEGRRRREAKRQEKRRADGPPALADPAPTPTPAPEKTGQ